MPSKDRQISLRVPAKVYEDFVFISSEKNLKLATLIKSWITEFIKENSEILRYDNAHINILVESEDGTREWISVTHEQVKRDYEPIDKEGKAVFKRKSDKK